MFADLELKHHEVPNSRQHIEQTFGSKILASLDMNAVISSFIMQHSCEYALALIDMQCLFELDNKLPIWTRHLISEMQLQGVNGLACDL